MRGSGLFWIFLVCAFPLAAVEISSSINTEKVPALESAGGSIDIRHDSDEKIDDQSFQQGGKPLQVKFSGSREEADGTVLSSYKFEIYPEKEGLNILAPISAVVGGRRYQSNPSTYSVEYIMPEKGLYLRALIQGKEPFYPGERLKFIYRIYFRGDVKLTKEELPLIDSESFQKIGGLEFKEFQYKGFKVNEFTQEVQILAPGVYSFGTSVLEGMINNKEKVRTEVKPFQITINPYPKQGQPPSFTKASGHFNVSTKLLTSDHIEVGDEASLKIEISGEGNVDTIRLPNFLCQPGFSGFFSLTGSPPVASTNENGKVFTVNIVPKTSLVKEIPPIQFSSFDPETREYFSTSSHPIPLTVSSRPLPVSPPPPLKQSPPVDWDKILLAVKPGPLPTPLESAQRESSTDPWNFLWLVPVFAFLWLLQYYGKDYWIAYRSRQKEREPRSLIKEASKYDIGSREFYRLIALAFKNDRRSEVKGLFSFLDAIRFGKMKGSKEEVLSKARALLCLILLTFGVLGAQNDSFNQRLDELLALEEKEPSAALYVDIGDTFYQLQRYSWALLYAGRALKYQPDSSTAETLAKESRKKLFLSEEQAFGLAPRMPVWTALILFFLVFAFASFYLWKKHPFILGSGLASLFVLVLFLLLAVKIHYFSPLPAIMINPSALYQGEGAKYAIISDRPVAAGAAVGVIGISKNGKWLKIQTANGMIGFIPLKNIRII